MSSIVGDIYKSVRSWIVWNPIIVLGQIEKKSLPPFIACTVDMDIIRSDHCSVAQIGQMSRRKRRDWKRLADSLAQVASVLKPREVQDRRPHPVHRSTSPSKIPKYNHIKHKDRNDRPLELPSRRENPNRRVQKDFGSSKPRQFHISNQDPRQSHQSSSQSSQHRSHSKEDHHDHLDHHDHRSGKP
jgi:hypothetical protein